MPMEGCSEKWWTFNRYEHAGNTVQEFEVTVAVAHVVHIEPFYDENLREHPSKCKGRALRVTTVVGVFTAIPGTFRIDASPIPDVCFALRS